MNSFIAIAVLLALVSASTPLLVFIAFTLAVVLPDSSLNIAAEVAHSIWQTIITDVAFIRNHYHERTLSTIIAPPVFFVIGLAISLAESIYAVAEIAVRATLWIARYHVPRLVKNAHHQLLNAKIALIEAAFPAHVQVLAFKLGSCVVAVRFEILPDWQRSLTDSDNAIQQDCRIPGTRAQATHQGWIASKFLPRLPPILEETDRTILEQEDNYLFRDGGLAALFVLPTAAANDIALPFIVFGGPKETDNYSTSDESAPTSPEVDSHPPTPELDANPQPVVVQESSPDPVTAIPSSLSGVGLALTLDGKLLLTPPTHPKPKKSTKTSAAPVVQQLTKPAISFATTSAAFGIVVDLPATPRYHTGPCLKFQDLHIGDQPATPTKTANCFGTLKELQDLARQAVQRVSSSRVQDVPALPAIPSQAAEPSPVVEESTQKDERRAVKKLPRSTKRSRPTPLPVLPAQPQPTLPAASTALEPVAQQAPGFVVPAQATSVEAAGDVKKSVGINVAEAQVSESDQRSPERSPVGHQVAVVESTPRKEVAVPAENSEQTEEQEEQTSTLASAPIPVAQAISPESFSFSWPWTPVVPQHVEAPPSAIAGDDEGAMEARYEARNGYLMEPQPVQYPEQSEDVEIIDVGIEHKPAESMDTSADQNTDAEGMDAISTPAPPGEPQDEAMIDKPDQPKDHPTSMDFERSEVQPADAPMDDQAAQTVAQLEPVVMDYEGPPPAEPVDTVIVDDGDEEWEDVTEAHVQAKAVRKAPEEANSYITNDGDADADGEDDWESDPPPPPEPPSFFKQFEGYGQPGWKLKPVLDQDAPVLSAPQPPSNPPAAHELVLPEPAPAQEEPVVVQEADTEMRQMKALPRKRLALRANTPQAGSVPRPTVPRPSLPPPVFKFTSQSMAPTSRADPMAIEHLEPKKPKFARINVFPIPVPSERLTPEQFNAFIAQLDDEMQKPDVLDEIYGYGDYGTNLYVHAVMSDFIPVGPRGENRDLDYMVELTHALACWAKATSMANFLARWKDDSDESMKASIDSHRKIAWALHPSGVRILS